MEILGRKKERVPKGRRTNSRLGGMSQELKDIDPKEFEGREIHKKSYPMDWIKSKLKTILGKKK